MSSTELTLVNVAMSRGAGVSAHPSTPGHATDHAPRTSASGTPAARSTGYPRGKPNIVGLGAVAALHVFIVWALVSGLAKSVIEVIKAPIETRMIEEVKPPPPPEKVPLPPPPPLAPPPPAYIPPPEVVVALPPPPAPTITTTTAPPPVAVTIAPTPPVEPTAPPTPVAARPTGKPARIDVASCERPEYPELAARAAASGTTKIRFAIDAAGAVVKADIERPSGNLREHRLLDRAAVAALSKCRFTPGTDEHGAPTGAHAIVDYVWRVE